MDESTPLPDVGMPTGRFFQPVDWKAFWTSLVISFGVFFYTMSPTVSLEDAGELAVAADYLGVPHPPGYPIWTIISWIFTKLFWFVTFRGQPNPAWAVSLVSVVFGALACGITAMLICRSGRDLVTESRSESHTADPRTDNLICWTGGVVSSLLLGFAPVMWSQTTIVEVYSLNAFFLALVFLLTYRWLRRPSDKVLYVAAFVFGLGLTNYQVLLLAVIALVVAVMLKDIDLFRDFLIVGIPFVVSLAICNLASQPPMRNFPLLPAYSGPGFERLLSHTPLGAHPAHYGGIVLTLVFIVAMAILAQHTRRPDGRPAMPAVLMAGGILALLVLLANFPSAIGRAEMAESSRVMNWTPYYLGFAAAMGALALLCCSLPGGYLLAAALISINVALAVVLRKGGLLGLYHPLSLWFAFYAGLNFLLLGLGWRFLPRGRTVAITIFMVELGLSIYAFMPLASDLRNPPMNWAYPRTWEGFKHAITRGQYEKIAPADIFSLEFLRVVGDFLTDLREQFSLPMALTGFLPFTVWQVTARGGRRIRALYVAIPMAVAASAIALFERVAVNEAGLLAPVYKLLSLGVLALLGAGALALFISQALEMIRKLPGSARTAMPERVTVGLVLAGAAAAVMLYMALIALAVLKVLDPLRSGEAVSAAQSHTALLQAGGLVALMVLPIAAVALLVWLMNSRAQFRVIIDHASQQWFIATLLGFLAMSFVLIALANPKGDIQDMFIQRVKFISSHALYAFWIGYGLIFGLAFVDTVFRRRALTWLAVAAALLFPVLPLHQNATNAELIRTVGGAEQTGHDYGWQFGNYQLRGAEAISEELEAGEEPLPDPTFPPPMGPNAVFFGGTDPGRFVPTYMIYSARVREDVYLITQNALADNTYMSVMRDLYGDQIWIPAQPDSAKAFQRYVDEVNTGKRPRNAELTIENGRVQVSGALGVMEINGILAQMIFEHNSYRHDFYVEESYVIPWMYPYLTPHGLIMKINARMLDLAPDVVRTDADFWDWYTRRLMNDPRFLRDVVARKSFSKLRSAIAGLYGSRMRLADAEEAFHQARLLYPLSPEANFRLVQEVLMRSNRFSESRDIMEDFGRQDPGNTKVPEFVAYLARIEGLTQRIRELEARRTQGQIDVHTGVELADLYYQAGQKGMYNEMLRRVLASKGVDPRLYLDVAAMLERSKDYDDMDTALTLFMSNRPSNTPAEIYLRVAQMYAAAQRPARMSLPMTEYLKLKPSDWKAWIDQASILMMTKQTDAAVRALENAIRTGGSEAIAVIREDPRFATIQNKAIERSGMNLAMPPGIGKGMGPF